MAKPPHEQKERHIWTLPICQRITYLFVLIISMNYVLNIFLPLVYCAEGSLKMA